MPLYEYVCAHGHQLEVLVLRPEDEPVRCGRAITVTLANNQSVEEVHHKATCDQPVKKVFSTPASQFPGANKW